MSTNKNIQQVNGPVNVVRLEGKVDSIDKVIYLFMDIHYELDQQMECDNIYAKDIHQYLATSFTNIDKPCDFYLEIFTFELQKLKYGYAIPRTLNNREIYLVETRKFFNKLFHHKPTENKVYTLPDLRNVRFHYIDIREYFHKYHFSTLLDVLNEVDRIWRNFDFTIDDLQMIHSALTSLKKHNEIILAVLNGKLKPNKPKKKQIIQYTDFTTDTVQIQLTPAAQLQSDVEYLAYIFNKMFNKYTHPTVQKKLSKHITSINNNIQLLIKESDQITAFCLDIIQIALDNPPNFKNKHIDYSTRQIYGYGLGRKEVRIIINKLYDDLDTFFNNFTTYFMEFMDVFFLRRFLDKDYVTNAIVYTGIDHSNNYIETLTHDFDFKITHCSYASLEINKLNRLVRKRSGVELLEFFLPPTKSQCSDLTHFPKNFD